MPEMNPDDLKVISVKLSDGRRHIRYIHEPSGKSVEEYTAGEPVAQVHYRLLAALRRALASLDQPQ